MSLRTWLLAGTSLSILAFAPLSVAHAQDATNADLVAAYQAYQADQSDAAKQKLTDACTAAGFASLDDCLAAMSAAAPAAPAAPPAPAVETPAAPAAETPAAPAAPAAEAPAAPAAPAAEAPAAPVAPEAPSSSSEEAAAPAATPAAPAAAPAQEQAAPAAVESSSSEAAPAPAAPAVAPAAPAAAPAAPAADQAAPAPSSSEEQAAPAPKPAGKGVLAKLTAAVDLYNQGVADLTAGNAGGQAKIDKAKGQIDQLCTAGGFADTDACLAQFNLTLNPLPATPAAAPAASSAEPAASSEQPAAPVDQSAASSAEPPASATPEVTASPAAPAAEASTPSVPPISELPNASEAVNPQAVEVLPTTVAPAEAAPILDSAKDSKNARGPRPGKGNSDQSSSSVPPDQSSSSSEPPAAPAQPPAPPPTTDKAAQADITPPSAAQQSTQTDKGKRHDNGGKPPVIQPTVPTDNPDVKVVQQPKNDAGGLVFSIGVNIYINNPEQERDRFYNQGRGDQIYTEDLSRGRTRETIQRKDGSKVVTIRDRNGDVLQRSKILPNGKEIVISSYDPRDNDNTNWRDPGDDLPPLQLNIPASQYILDADSADEGDVQNFLDQPPVEQVKRIYTIDEVKRSARLRDSVRRLEVGGLTFDTGKATISRDQVGALSNVASAMQKILAKSPGDVFLIEGHTDAVGSDVSNLVLSDQRASTVARILTDFYDIPPENLVTQGYGERYLKVQTDGPEPLNRRVTIKNISTLVNYASN